MLLAAQGKYLPKQKWFTVHIFHVKIWFLQCVINSFLNWHLQHGLEEWGT